MRTIAAILLLLANAATGSELGAAGRTALYRGDLDRAVTLLRQAAELEPKNARHRYYLGATYVAKARTATFFGEIALGNQARAEFEKALALDPGHFEARMGLIDYYVGLPSFFGGDVQQAMEQAAEIRKRDVLKGHRAFARIYTLQQKNDLARAEYMAAVRRMPKSAPARYYLGTFLIRQRDYDAGIREIDTALKLDPAYMPAWFRVGVYAGSTGKETARGEASLKKYLAYTPAEDEPRPEWAWYWLGRIYEKQGKMTLARNSYLQGQKLAPKFRDIADALKRIDATPRR